MPPDKITAVLGDPQIVAALSEWRTMRARALLDGTGWTK
jgi:hypothetical protein